jgi:formamidopyrimidine-DNA glycosylase
VTTRPEHRSRRRGPASRPDAFYVYRRTGEPCRICGTPVQSEEMAGRTLYWCPVCQAGVGPPPLDAGRDRGR